MAPRASKQLLTLAQAEEMTGRKIATFRKDIRLRMIPSVRLGRQVRIPMEAIEALIQKGWIDSVGTIQG